MYVQSLSITSTGTSLAVEIVLKDGTGYKMICESNLDSTDIPNDIVNAFKTINKFIELQTLQADGSLIKFSKG